MSQGWVSTEVVLEHLGGIGRRTLRAMMRDTPAAGLPGEGDVWFDIGTGRRRVWKWDLACVDEWAKGVGRWRATIGGARGIRSGGETPTAESGLGRSRTTRPQGSSPGRSSEPTLSERVGSLRTLTRSRKSRSSSTSTKKTK